MNVFVYFIKRFLIIIIVSLFIGANCYSQIVLNDRKSEITTPQIDSLKNILKTIKPDTIKVKVLKELCQEYIDHNSEKALQYGEQGLQLSIKLNYKLGQANCLRLLGIYYDNNGNYKLAFENYIKSSEIYSQLGIKDKMASCYTNIGVIFYSQGNHSKALEFYRKSLKLYKILGNETSIAYCYTNIGNLYLDQSDYSKAVEYFQKAEKIAEKVGDKLVIAACNANIGGIYYYQQSFSKSLEYYNKALKISEEIDDKSGSANCLNNIGNIYYSQNFFKESLVFFQKSLKIRQEIGDNQGIASCYNNLGNVNNGQNNFVTANDYFCKALKIYETLGDTGWISVVYLNLSELNVKLKKYNIATEYAEKSLLLASKIGELQTVSLAYENLAKSYKGLFNYQKAFESYELFKKVNDSIFNSDKHQQFVEMEAIYQGEKKQKEIELKETQLAKKDIEVKQEKTMKYAFVIGFILMIILSGFILKSYRDKRKANLKLSILNNEITIQSHKIEEKNEELNQQNEEIRTQRDEIESQRDLVEVQKEHIQEIFKQVTDSINYAKRIQEAVLPISIESRSVLGEHFILFKPKDIVSGDFYWTVKINNLLFVAVADCTGHGVPGAFMSMLGISFLNEIVHKQEIKNPNQILNHLREEIVYALQQKGVQGEQKDGMDISLLVVNTDTNEAQWAGANNPLYIISSVILNVCEEQFSCEAKSISSNIDSSQAQIDNRDIMELKGNKMPIAIYPQMKDFTSHEFSLQKGDSVYLFTDGYADQFGGPSGRKFMYKQFKEMLLQNNNKPMKEQREILEFAFENWKGEFEQIDDVTILGIRI